MINQWKSIHVATITKKRRLIQISKQKYEVKFSEKKKKNTFFQSYSIKATSCSLSSHRSCLLHKLVPHLLQNPRSIRPQLYPVCHETQLWLMLCLIDSLTYEVHVKKQLNWQGKSCPLKREPRLHCKGFTVGKIMKLWLDLLFKWPKIRGTFEKSVKKVVFVFVYLSQVSY